MANTVKCRNTDCGKQTNKESAIKHPDKLLYFCCQDCLTAYQAKQQSKSKNKLSPQESQDYKALISYIQQIYGKEYNQWGWMLKKIKELKEEHKWKYTGMLYTLQYCVNILRLKINTNYDLSGLLTYYYPLANKHYQKTIEITKTSQKYRKDEITTVKTSHTERKLFENFD